MRIVFFGTPDIGLPTLELLHKKLTVVGIVTQSDKLGGRGNKLIFNPIKDFGIKNNIPVYQPEKLRNDFDFLNTNIDFFVTFAYGQILTQEILDIPKYATINLHASLLPKYRGANPIQRCIMNGDKETGICTMITEIGMDCGDICLQEKIEIGDMNCQDLYNKIKEISPKLVLNTLLNFKNIIPKKQIGEPTLAPKLKKEECLIDWSRSDIEIYNLIRGVYPNAYFIHNGKRIKVLKAKYDGELKILTVKPEGKKEMSKKDWLNGLR